MIQTLSTVCLSYISIFFLLYAMRYENKSKKRFQFGMVGLILSLGVILVWMLV